MKIVTLNPPYFPMFSRASRSPAVTKSSTLYYPFFLSYATGVLEDDGFDRETDVCGESLLKLELPLLGENKTTYGTLWLIKDLERDPISHYTLRRVEHLRRTVIGTLEKLA